MLSAAPAFAGGVDMSYENFQKTSTGSVEVVLKFTNNTGKNVSVVMADCAFLDANKKALTVVPVAAQNIPAGQYAYGHSYSPPKLTGIEHAECRVRDYDSE